MLSFEAASVASLSIKRRAGGASLRLTRKGDSWLASGKKVQESRQIEAAIATLARLRADGFSWYPRDQLGLAPPGWTVDIRLQGGTRHRLLVGSVERDARFALQIQGRQELFTLRKHTLPHADLAVHVVTEVLLGLHHLHQLADDQGRPLGLVHRDVSPSNVLVSTSGEVKLADYGIVKATRLAGNTAANIRRGKFGYMSLRASSGSPATCSGDM